MLGEKAPQQRAEQYVREKCPELMEIEVGSVNTVPITHAPTIQLQHWLKELPENSRRGISLHVTNGQLYHYGGSGRDLYFNLTTGQPATEADYQAFLDIVGV